MLDIGPSVGLPDVPTAEPPRPAAALAAAAGLGGSACPMFLRLNPQGLRQLLRHPGRKKRIPTWLSWLRGPLSGPEREGVDVTVMRESDNLHFCGGNIY